jgi:AcrR family transcriptional regulator
MPVQKIEKYDFLLRCWEVFHKQGYHNTSMQDLAKATGLQKAGLYHHYATKQQLMEAVMEFAMNEFRNYVLSVADEAELPVEQRFEKLLRRTRRLAILHRQGCFFANIALETGRDDLFNGLLLRAMNEWTNTLTGLFQHVVAPEVAKVKAKRIIMEYEGAVLFYKLSGDQQYIEDYIERIVTEFHATATQQGISI